MAAGRITKDEADAMKAAINSGKLPIGIPGAGPGFHHGFGFRGDILDAAATYLGLTEDQLRTQLESGKSLADVAKAQNKSVDGLKQAIVAAFQSKLDQAVKDGRLTSDQRDQMLADFKAHIDDLVNGTPPARAAGAFHDGFRFAPGGFHAPFPAETPGTLQPTA